MKFAIGNTGKYSGILQRWKLYVKGRSSPVWLAEKLCYFESFLSYIIPAGFV